MEQDQAGKWNETTVSRTVVTNESGEAVLEDLPLGRYKVEELGLDSSDGSDAVLPNEKDDAMVGKAFYVDVPMTQATVRHLIIMYMYIQRMKCCLLKRCYICRK